MILRSIPSHCLNQGCANINSTIQPSQVKSIIELQQHLNNFLKHHNEATKTTWRPISPLVQAYGTVYTSKHCITGLLWGESTGDRLRLTFSTRCAHLPSNCYQNSPQLNTIRPEQYGRHSADDISAVILKEMSCVLIQISLKYVIGNGPISQHWLALWNGAEQATIPWVKTLGSPSIRHRSDTVASDRCLVGVDSKVFAVMDVIA